MKRKLNLVVTQEQHEEKRIFPRFPYYFLTFRSEGQTFEVADIGHTGMRVKLATSPSPSSSSTAVAKKWSVGSEITGVLRWRQQNLSLVAEVKWLGDNSVGAEFSSDGELLERIEQFLSPENLALTLHPLHHPKLSLDLPPNLRYWLKGDAPVEIFVWYHGDNTLSEFQVIVLDNYLEWRDGTGIRSGKLLWGRPVDSPLKEEEEYTILVDHVLDTRCLQIIDRFLNAVSNDYLPPDVILFMKSKLT